jgi:predicted TIM-barrel fold metal-dependent hydrolase
VPAPLVDLSGADIVDNHCHGLVVDELLKADAATFEARLTLTGQAYITSNQDDPAVWRSIETLVEGNAYSLISRRWLCEFLNCPEDPASLARARDSVMRADPVGYTRRLLADQNIVELVADEGYTHMPVGGAELERLVAIPVHRVARIESFIDDLKARQDLRNLDEFADALQQRLDQAAADPRTIALKSVIAYRTGLDIAAEPARSEAASAFHRWRAAAWADSRADSKPVRDYLLHRAMEIIQRHDIALHIHCGDGDPDVVFAHSRPQDLFSFLRRYHRQPIVLMHAGHPWSEEAAYIAAILPHVYIDLSVLIPWASLNIESHLSRLIGMMPSSKLLYSSDQVYEPELFWLPARFARRALERALGAAADAGYLTPAAGQAIGHGILAGNTRRVHGIHTR